MSLAAALALCRFAGAAAAMLLWGAFGFLAFLAPPALRDAMAPRWERLRVAASLVAALASLALLPLETATIGAGWADAADPALLGAVLWTTAAGFAWRMRALVAALLLAALAVPPRPSAAASAVAAALLLTSLALTGHAAMDEGVPGALHRLDDAVHLLAGGAWLGALAPLLPVLDRLGEPPLRGPAALALRRFSRAGHAAVALVIASGVANTALVLGRWPLDARSPYQMLLLAKIVLVAAMTALALANRYRAVPRLATQPEAALRFIRRATLAEIVLGMAAVALAAVFGQLEPA